VSVRTMAAVVAEKLHSTFIEEDLQR
jgi:hypothetical protein